jgi:hypothetical protein
MVFVSELGYLKQGWPTQIGLWAALGKISKILAFQVIL